MKKITSRHLLKFTYHKLKFTKYKKPIYLPIYTLYLSMHYVNPCSNTLINLPNYRYIFFYKPPYKIQKKKIYIFFNKGQRKHHYYFQLTVSNTVFFIGILS